jgi:lipoyl(octanoyl) transferase
MSGTIGVVDLGRRRYGEVLELQRRLCRERIAGTRARDLLLLVEHEPVVTLGRGTRASSLPIPPALLAARGFAVAEVERGGDVTLHAPGQLVGYPIFDLAGHRPDLHWYLRQLEEALILGLAGFGLIAGRRTGLTGVWIDDRKIASIGIHVKQWVTFHGFALNVTTALSLFDVIVPCGIAGVEMTSIARELGADRPQAALWADAIASVTGGIGQAFERPMVVMDPASLLQASPSPS